MMLTVELIYIVNALGAGEARAHLLSALPNSGWLRSGPSTRLGMQTFRNTHAVMDRPPS